MQPQRPPHGAYHCTLMIQHPHDYTTVKLALGRAVTVNGTAAEFFLGPEKPACSRVLIGKGMINKQVPFVIIDLGDERCSGRN